MARFIECFIGIAVLAVVLIAAVAAFITEYIKGKKR